MVRCSEHIRSVNNSYRDSDSIQVYCADEVKSHLAVPDVQFIEGPTTLGTRGTFYDNASAFVCEDANYLSARYF